MLSKSMIPFFKKLFRNPFFIAFLIGIASLHIVKTLSLARRSAPPPLVNVGEWALTSQSGQKFGSANLKGKIVIANFFFTRCPSICPKLMNDMREVSKRFEKEGDEVHFVSFSVDPEFDTPAVLSQYQDLHHYSLPNWTFLTGTVDEMIDVASGKMKLHVGDKIDKDGLFDIAHVVELLLFDQNGDLRGKFDTSPTGLAAIVRSAKFLLEKGSSG